MPKRIPLPVETPVDIITAGRTSTLKSIKIVNVGQNVPKTFSRDMLHNTPGFNWYVSNHFALKTNHSEEMSRFYITLLEMAYPHYVSIFGEIIPQWREKRFGMIFGTNYEAVHRATLDDRMYVLHGGGITQEGFYCAYQMPSNEYHSRYILLHECVHLYQYCMTGTTRTTPGWYIEGIADYFSSHVWDPVKQRLTVQVLDRAPVHNFLEYGKKIMAEKPELTFEKLHKEGSPDRGVNVLMTTFLQSTPEYLQKFRIFQKELFRTGHYNAQMGDTAGQLLNRLYGPWEQINEGFKRYVDLVNPTFKVAVWGFDQYDNTMVSFGYPPKERQFSQLNMAVVPQEKTAGHDFYMDYQQAPLSVLVDAPVRGVDEPVLGCVVDFSKADGKGMAGMGLGREEFKHCKILVKEASELIIDGADLGMDSKTLALKDATRKAMSRSGNKAGLSIKIGTDKLEVRLKAGAKGDSAEAVSIKINDEQRKMLLARPICLIGVGARHLITPFVDDGRKSLPDPDVARPLNRWCSVTDGLYYGVSCAIWYLGDKAPQSLKDAHDRLRSVSSKSDKEQLAERCRLEEIFPALLKDVDVCDADGDDIQKALSSLSGMRLHVRIADAKTGQCKVITTIEGPVFGTVKGVVDYKTGPKSVVTKSLPGKSYEVGTAAINEVSFNIKRPDINDPFYVKAETKVKLSGVSIKLNAMASGNPSISKFWILGPFDNEGKMQDKENAEIEQKPPRFDIVYQGQAGNKFMWTRYERSAGLDVDAENMYYFNWHMGQANNAYAYLLTYIHSPKEQEAVLAVGASDGLAAWINDEKVFTFLTAQDWSPREHKIVMKLKKGANKILLKSIHGGALWMISAHVEDKSGMPINGITAELE